LKYIAFAGALLAGVPLMALVASTSEKWRRVLLAVLVFSAVLGDMASINFVSTENYRGPDRGFEVTLTDLVALGLALGLVLRPPGRIRWLPFNTGWLLAGFALACVSTAAAPVPLFGVFTLFKLARVYLVYWCVANVLATERSIDPLRWGWVAIGVFTAALALKQKYLDGLYRISGPLDHSNGIPLYSNLIIPALLLWGLTDRRLSRQQAGLTILASLGLVFAVVATQSRAGTVLSGACVFGALGVANLRASSRRVSATTAFVLACVVAGGVVAADTIVRRFQEAPESSEEARHEFNAAAKLMAADHRFGVGLNSFSRVLTDEPRYHQFIEVMKGEEQAGVAHHIYWLTAAETGYPGLVVFLIVIGRFAWQAGWMAWRHRAYFEGLLLAGSLLGFCALHAQGTLEWGLRITPITFVFAVACATVAGVSERLRDLEARLASPSGA
jgi:hypothetical protein